MHCHRLRPRSAVTAICLLLPVLAACAIPPPEGPIRLVDTFNEADVTLREAVAAAETPGWQFGEAETLEDTGWQAAMSVADLQLKEGALNVRAADDFPLLYVPIQAPEGGDSLHRIGLRLRTDRDGKLSAKVMDEPPAGPRGPIQGVFPWPFQAEVTAGDEWQDVILTATSEVPVEDQAFLVLRASDAAEAEFALQSVEITFRRESFLAEGPGISWQGVDHAYKETLVTRAGDQVVYDLQLPENAWLDFATSQVGAAGSSFQIEVEAGGEAAAVFERIPEQPDQWEAAEVDLSDWSGRQVRLKLSLASTGAGDAVGFWGAPAVRSRLAQLDGPRGVIVIVTDTLRRDHLDLYGYERDTAPNLGRLAREGMLAVDPISQSSWTKLAVTSIFTSMYPASHGVKGFHDRLPASAETMAEMYRDAGYATLGLSSIPFTGKFTNLHQGYETMVESASLEATRAKTARVYVERMLPWVEAHADSKFFIFLHVADPHSPYEPYEPYDDLYAADGDLEQYLEQQNLVRPFIEHSDLMRFFGMPLRSELEAAGLDPEEYVSYELDAYDGSIRGMDVELQKVIDALRELGIEDEVLVAIVSDHGTEFLDHDAHFHGHTLYGELTRVPLMLWGPGFVPAGIRLAQPVQTIDLMPTLLELSGLPVPERVQGRSLVPAIRGEQSPREQPAFSEVYSQPMRSTGDPAGENNWWAVTTGEWKLVVKRPVEGSEDLPAELYDRSEDPLDHNDVAGGHPEVVAELSRLLDQWRASTEQAQLPSDEQLGATLSEAEAEELRALGYLQ